MSGGLTKKTGSGGLNSSNQMKISQIKGVWCCHDSTNMGRMRLVKQQSMGHLGKETQSLKSRSKRAWVQVLLSGETGLECVASYSLGEDLGS